MPERPWTLRFEIPHPTETLSLALSRYGPQDFVGSVIQQTEIPGGPNGQTDLYRLTRFPGASEPAVLQRCRDFLADKFGIEATPVRLRGLEAQG